MPTRKTMKTVFLGSQLWVTAHETQKQLLDDVRGMLNQNLTLARIFVTYSAVMKERRFEPGVWDQLFRICDEEGLKLCVTLSALAETGRWAYGTQPSLEQWEENRQDVLFYLTSLVRHFKDHPCLDSWILQNEPHEDLCLNGMNVMRFRKYLKQQNSLQELEELYHTASPDNIGWVSQDGEKARVPGLSEPGEYPSRIDWARFNREVLVKRLEEAGRIVKAEDPMHPTTVNADALATATPSDGGRDVFALGKTVDFLGCSAHVSWHSVRFPVSRLHQSVAMFADMTRSATADPNGVFWVTELQGGTNFFSGIRPMCPTGADISHWIWESLGTGAKGVVFWLYKAREQGFEGLEWGLMDQKGQQSDRSEAAGKIGAFLSEHGGKLFQMEPKPYDGLIFRSTDTCLLSHAEHGTMGSKTSDLQTARNQQMILDAVSGAYLLLQDMGLDAGFLSEETLGKLKETVPFLIVPNAYGLRADVVKAMLNYVRQGGTLIADGLFAAKDPYGRRRSREVDQMLDELFGDQYDDFRVQEEPMAMYTPENEALPMWFLDAQWYRLQHAEGLAYDPMQRACVIRHRLGRGYAIEIGTLFFQNYFRSGGEIVSYRNFLEGLVPARQIPYRLQNPSPFLRRKILQDKDSVWMIVMNRSGAPAQARLSSPYGWQDLETGEKIVPAAGLVSVELAPEQVRVLQLAKDSYGRIN